MFLSYFLVEFKYPLRPKAQVQSGLLCSCTDRLPLSLTGPHSPQANTQLKTDKATLLDSSQLVSLSKCVNNSLFLSLGLPSSSPFWTFLYGHISSFYLTPISPHPISHSASFAPWEEDVSSCCAQLFLSEVPVCVCGLAWGHEGGRESIWKHHYRAGVLPSVLITVNFFLFLWFCLFLPHRHSLQGSVTLLVENEKMWKWVKVKKG